MQQFNSKLLIIGVLTVALCATVILADDVKDTQLRGKRSFSWLPFFGGDARATDEESDEGEEAEEAIETGDAEDGTSVVGESFGDDIPSDLIVPQQIQYAGNYPNAVPIETILSKGQVINNRIHYPIWRVHKYNGIHLKPIPISLVQGNAQTLQTVPQGIYPPAQPLPLGTYPPAQPLPLGTYPPAQPVQHSGIPSQGSVNQFAIPGQQSFGSNQNNLGGGSTKPSQQRVPPELLKLARQFGVTDLSKFPSLEEAMSLLGTTTQEETIKAIQELAATEDGRALIKQFIDSEGAASELEEQIVDAPASYNENLNTGPFQHFYQIPNQGYRDHETAATDLIGIRDFDSSLNRANTDFNIVQGILPSAPEGSNIFQRIAQWTSFLNPLAGNEEIPLPSNDDDDAGEEATDYEENDEQSIALPQLPELPLLPSIPGLGANVGNLPQVHIPRHFVAPPQAAVYPVNIAALGKTAGSYVHVKVPTPAVNRVVQYHPGANVQVVRPHVQPQPLPQAQPQLIRQPQRIQYIVRQPAQVTGFKTVPQQNIQVQPKPVVQAHAQLQFELPHQQLTTKFISNVQPAVLNIEHKQQLDELKLPAVEGPTLVHHVGQIPLIKDANYEVFKNAPRIVTSYGTPALPYTYSLDSSSNTFMPSFIHQEYELRPAASEKSEQKEESVDGLPANHAYGEIHHNPDSKSKTSLNIHDAAPAHDSVSNDSIEDEHSSKTTDEIQRRASLPESDEDVDEPKEIAYSGPQRITSFDTIATGRIHKADKNAINLLPLTMRQAGAN